MGIIGIDHVQPAMPAGGEVSAIAFYVGLLGLEQVPKPPQIAAGGHRVAAGEQIDGYERVHVEDPFGNRVELMQPSV